MYVQNQGPLTKKGTQNKGLHCNRKLQFSRFSYKSILAGCVSVKILGKICACVLKTRGVIEPISVITTRRLCQERDQKTTRQLILSLSKRSIFESIKIPGLKNQCLFICSIQGFFKICHRFRKISLKPQNFDKSRVVLPDQSLWYNMNFKKIFFVK